VGGGGGDTALAGSRKRVCNAEEETVCNCKWMKQGNDSETNTDPDGAPQGP